MSDKLPHDTSVWNAARALMKAAWALLKRKTAPDFLQAARRMIRAAEREARLTLLSLAAALTPSLSAPPTRPSSPKPKNKPKHKPLRPRSFSVLPPARTYADYAYEYRPQPLVSIERPAPIALPHLEARLEALSAVLGAPGIYAARLARLMKKRGPARIQLRYRGAGFSLPEDVLVPLRKGEPPPSIDSS